VAIGTRRVREVMKPRVELAWISAEADVDTVREVVQRTRRAVLAVKPRGGGVGLGGGSSGDAEVVGLLHVKPYLAAAELRGRGPVDLMRYCDPPVFVPETARVDSALDILRRRGAGMVLCVDEHGDLSGWLEPEDIADELLRGLGEDDPSGGQRVQLIGLGRWWVPGGMRLHEVERHFGLADGSLAVASGEGTRSARVTTLGGLISDRLGRLAGVGDAIEAGGVRLVVSEVRGRRVTGVELELAEGAGPAVGDGAVDGVGGGA
jgi:putative hemolysin